MRKKRKGVNSIVAILLLLCLSIPSHAAMMRESSEGGGFAKPAVAPNEMIRVHDVGKIWLTISNYATFANPHDLDDPRDGYYGLAPSCMFPGGSNLEYLFSEFMWIGAVKDTLVGGLPALDTLVSIGGDGWLGIESEMWPDFAPNGGITVRSTRPPDVYPYGDTVGAISEQDFISVFTDTKTDPSYVPIDPYDQSPHSPLGIEVTQKSYAWSYEYAEDFILFDYDIVNTSNKSLRDVWLGLYIDADVWHTSENPYGSEQGAQDDICGFVDSVVTAVIGVDTTKAGIFTAYIADNDGQVYGGAFDSFLSPRGVSGVRVIRSPNPELGYSFNWWISNTNPDLDWGPQLLANFIGPFPSGGYGTPGPDWSKYFVMSNGEFDYDQIRCNLDWTGEGWREASSQASDLANGYDTRYLFSFGPFAEIPAGDTLKLTTAYICGENLHVDPDNYRLNLQTFTGDENSVNTYYRGLDFQDFATNSQWADWVYDNPGVDTDTTDDVGYDGWWVEGTHFLLPGGSADTIWIKGDGVPDFRGPPPPASPTLTINTEPGTVVLQWNGSRTQADVDIFSGQTDFEGYRIYMSHSGRLGEYTLLGDFDIIDYDSTYIDSTSTPYVWKLWNYPPRPLARFAELFPNGFDPDTSDYWVPHSWNAGLNSIAIDDTLYTYTINGLSESSGLYFAVTAYDYGNPITKLSPLESSATINAKRVYPIARGGVIDNIAVYPNPYKIDGGYETFEDPYREGRTEFDRRIFFSGLPSKCTIRIFTLDGDLVRQIDHQDATSLEAPGINYWDLISRNTQAVVSGVYLYSIETENGDSKIGKLAIIK